MGVPKFCAVLIIMSGVHEILDTGADALENENGFFKQWWENHKATPWTPGGFPNPDFFKGGGGYDPFNSHQCS